MYIFFVAFNRLGPASMIVIPFICGILVDLVSQYLGKGYPQNHFKKRGREKEKITLKH